MIITYTSSRPVGSLCALITRRISVWIAASSTHAVQPGGPVPSGGGSGSEQVESLPVGSASVSTIAPPNVKSYAAGPVASWYWPINPNTLLVERSAATTRSRNVSICRSYPASNDSPDPDGCQ